MYSSVEQVLDENDNDPQFVLDDYSGHVSEDVSVDTPILTVRATDIDDGMNANITYSIVSSSASEEPTPFKIDSLTGVISTSE